MASEEKAGGLTLITSVFHTGIVKEAGPGTPTNPTIIKKGNKVIYKPADAVQINLDGEQLLVLKENTLIFFDETD